MFEIYRTRNYGRTELFFEMDAQLSPEGEVWALGLLHPLVGRR